MLMLMLLLFLINFCFLIFDYLHICIVLQCCFFPVFFVCVCLQACFTFQAGLTKNWEWGKTLLLENVNEGLWGGGGGGGGRGGGGARAGFIGRERSIRTPWSCWYVLLARLQWISTTSVIYNCGTFSPFLFFY